LSLFYRSAEKFKELEEKTGYSKVYFFLGAFTLIAILIFVTGGIKLFSDLVGFLYPAYMSFKALEGGKSVDGDATQWMTYWIVFCFLTLIESAFPFLIEYIKWYYLIKCAFVIWLYHPKTVGAEVIYSSAVRPYVLPLLEGSGATTKTAAAKPVQEKKDE
jgi:receptor expression-enhancing protein 5/6